MKMPLTKVSTHNYAAATGGTLKPQRDFQDEAAKNSSAKTATNSSLSSLSFPTSSSSNSFQPRSTSTGSSSFRRRARLDTEISSRLKTSKKGSIKSNRHVRALTVNKLRFSDVGFYGRKNEITKLLNILAGSSNNHASSSSRSKEFVLLHGYSGVGKTTLASHFGEAVMMVETGVFVTGKFHRTNLQEPYKAISEAYGDVLLQIMNKEHAKKSAFAIQKKIHEDLRTEIKLLRFLVPGLEEFLSKKLDNGTSTSRNHKIQDVKEDNSDTKTMHERLKFAFRVLNRILTTHISPLAIVLDDLQWADAASMSIIETLLSDDQNPNSLMLIGMYRSNEVDESHIVSTTCHQLKQDKNSSNLYSITEMEVSNLGLDEVTKTIMALLSMDNSFEIYELSELCYRRTLGNPFFLIKFMGMLEEKELLEFNLGSFQWTWDLKKIEEETVSAANAVDLLQARMKEMPNKLQKLLFVAACLGSEFRVKELNIVLKHLDFQYFDEIPKFLDYLVEQCFVEHSSFDWTNFESGAALMTYRWVHDKVQEAALSLVEDEEKLWEQHFEMGLALYEELSEEELDKIVLYVAKMINYGLKSGRQSLEFARLNLISAEKAKMVSAFQTAATYASAGIKFLPSEYWTADRSLALHLYSIGAEMFAAVGKEEKMNLYCDFVLENATSALEKLRVCKIKANSIARIERNYDEAINICVDLLKELGLYIPKNSGAIALKAIAGGISAAKATKNDSRIEEMPIITDRNILVKMDLLDRLYYYSYMSSNTMLFLLCLTKIIRLTNLHGICNFSPSAFVVWGMIQGSILGKVRAGTQSAEKAIRMQERLPSKAVEAATVCRAHVLVFHSSSLIHDSARPLMERGYRCAMQSGDIETAMLSLVAGDISIPLMSGRELTAVKRACKLALSQAKQLGSYENILFIKMVLQTIMNLEDRANNTVLLKGPVLDEDDEVNISTPIDRILVNYMKSFLYAIFAEYELGAALALKKGNEFAKGSPGNMSMLHDTFLRGVSLYAMARKVKKRKFIRSAKEIRKLMKLWLKEGNPNVRHYVCLFDAEQAVLDKKYNAAESLYREGIKITTRGGYLHDSGMLHERYADFLINVALDKKQGKTQIEKAIRIYKEYGAIRKVKLLECNERVPSQLFLNGPPS